MALPAFEFIRRYLQHVVPTGFVRIRHYGLLANRHRQEMLQRCRELLHGPVPECGEETAPASAARDSEPVPTAPTWQTCPSCGRGWMIWVEDVEPGQPYNRLKPDGNVAGKKPAWNSS
jgi:hypothetical protein